MIKLEEERRESRLPLWLKVERPGTAGYFLTKAILRSMDLHTVCEEARCPNMGECFGHKTATFMLLGNVCTRGCRYCAVSKGHPHAVDKEEPRRLVAAVQKLGLEHVVLTSVDRDDLPDGGAGHFAETVRAIKCSARNVTVEVLIPDFRGQRRDLTTVLETPVNILSHNVETVPRLYPVVRGGGRYEWTLSILRWSKEIRREIPTKTGLMLGLGETRSEVVSVFEDLVKVGCEILTLGQYLQPTKAHTGVKRYIPPNEFSELKHLAIKMGFRHVEAGPLVRSSYHAWEYASR